MKPVAFKLMGQLHATCTAPTVCEVRAVAAQVEFERHDLKPALTFKGKGLQPVAFKLWVKQSFQLAPPHQYDVSMSSMMYKPRGVAEHRLWV